MPKKKLPNPGSDEGEWRDIPGWEGRYQASSCGLVRSLNWERVAGRVMVLTPMLYKGRGNKVGYYRTRLFKEGMVFSYPTHRLIAMTFIPNPDGKPEPNHKNGDTLDNRSGNLEWTTRSENQKHAIATGLAKRPINPATQFDAGIQYRWKNFFDGRLFMGTPSALARHIGGDVAYLYRLVSPKYKHHHSYRGWELIGHSSRSEKTRCVGRFKKPRRTRGARKP